MDRILIIEDEPDLILSLEEDLRRQGYQTQVASDGEQGLGLGKQGEWDLILLDVMLPKMDGFDVASELRRAGKTVEITPQELRLLEVFFRNPGRVLSRNQLIEAAWGPGTAITDRAVDTHVFNLRKKIEPVPSKPRFLIGVRGLGYRFDK